jgi:hypothetical protein
MTTSRWRHGIPAFLVGVALALGAQVSAGLLLYGGPGFLPALAIVLATASFALGAGLAAPAGASGSDGGEADVPWSEVIRGPVLAARDVEGARRRWLALLLAFTAAAFFAGGWEIFRGFGARGFTQGTGLAFLVALPMYAGGRILASPALRLPPSPPPGRGGWGSAPWALAGAAAGFLALAFVFFPMLSPTAVFLFCVVATSGGALIHGWLLDEVAQAEVESIAAGCARIRWRRARPREERVAWIARGGEAIVRGGGGEPVTPLEKAVEEGILPALAPPGRVVIVGWTSLPMVLSTSPREADIQVIDPDAGRVAWLASDLESTDGPPRIVHRARSIEEWLEAGGGPPVDLVVSSGVPFSRDRGSGEGASWDALHGRLRPGGVVVLHGMHEDRDGVGFAAPIRAASGVFERCAVYLGPDEASGRGAPPRSGFLVCRRFGGVRPEEDAEPDAFPERAGAFARVTADASPAEPRTGMVAGKRA